MYRFSKSCGNAFRVWRSNSYGIYFRNCGKRNGYTHNAYGLYVIFIYRKYGDDYDFEYEESIADINRKLSGIETIFLFTEPDLASVSSSVVKELLRYGKDVSSFLPEGMDI